MMQQLRERPEACSNLLQLWCMLHAAQSFTVFMIVAKGGGQLPAAQQN